VADKKLPMNRRTFLQGLAGIIAAPFVKGAIGSKIAAKTAVAAPEMAASGMPAWFPLLVNKIKEQGKQTMFAGSKKQPENIWKLENNEGVTYTLYEDAITGNMLVTTRGDELQEVGFEYIPATQHRRPDGKYFTEEGEFYSNEFQKGEFNDFENGGVGIDELKLGIQNIEDFATSGTKLSTKEAEDVVGEYIKSTTKIDYDGYANGGRVGYNQGNIVTKEEWERRVRAIAEWERINNAVEAMERMRNSGFPAVVDHKDGLSSQGYYNSMDDIFFGGINYNDGNKNLNVGTVIPTDGQPSYNAEFSFQFANGGPVIRPQGLLPPERGPMYNGLSNLFRRK